MTLMRFSSYNCCLLTVYSTLSEVIKSCLKLCVGRREGVFWHLVGFSTRQKVASFFFFFLTGTVPPQTLVNRTLLPERNTGIL